MDWLTKIETLERGDVAERAVAKIARDIRNRRYTGGHFEGMDDDIVCDMMDTWVAHVRTVMKDGSQQADTVPS